MNSPGTGSAGARRAQRQLLRRRRAALPPAERVIATHAILRHVAASHWLARGRRLGLYLTHGSELDTRALVALARRRGCEVYLPRIVHYRHQQMRFYRHGGGAARRNRYGIAEPAGGIALDVRRLSLLFLPLVGFDARGTRLGSGQGYYDRALQFRRRQPWRRPLLVGLGFACQQLDRIERQPHDIPLDAIVTETGIHHFHAPTRNHGDRP